MTELSCAVVRDLLPLYTDELASEESRTLVQSHLQHCEDCQAQLAAMQAAQLEISHNAAQSLQHAKRRLRGIKVAVAVVTSLAILAGLATLLYAMRDEIMPNPVALNVRPRDVSFTREHWQGPELRLVITSHAHAFEGVERVEISRTAIEYGYEIEDVYIFTLRGTRTAWLFSTLGLRRHSTQWTIPLEYSFDWYPWLLDEETGYYTIVPDEPQWHTTYHTVMRVYFVRYNNLAAFQALDDPLTAEAEGLATLLWARE
ncbi:MAG: zf-HC2 domain-containing protein [Oscillospiraceae bacterium]|nr:zf-HC2 domain-containing protein [Oscillospiraceae bacterium]